MSDTENEKEMDISLQERCNIETTDYCDLKTKLRAVKLDLDKQKDSNFDLVKKLNKQERIRLEETTKSNDKIISLQTQIAKLRNQNEKNSMEHEALEVELATFKQRVREYEKKLTASEADFDKSEVLHKDRIEKLQDTLNSRERIIKDLEHKFSINEQDLLARIQNMTSFLDSQKTKLEGLSAEKEELSASLALLDGNLDQAKDANDRLVQENAGFHKALINKEEAIHGLIERLDQSKKDQERLVYQVRALDENLEGERAAHMESKFNAELVQLRLRESELAVSEERRANKDAAQLVDQLTHRLQQAEAALEAEAGRAQVCQTEIDKIKNETTSQQENSLVELIEKKRTVGELTKQLDNMANRLSQQQAEMERTRQSLTENQTSSQTVLQEIDVLLDRFSGKKKSVAASPSKEAISKRAARHVLDELKALLQRHSLEIERAGEERKRLTTEMEVVGREAKTAREQAAGREKVVQAAGQAAVQAGQEAKESRKRVVDLERKVAELRAANTEMRRTLERERAAATQVAEELDRSRKMRKTENQERNHFARQLCQRVSSAVHQIEYLSQDSSSRQPNSTQEVAPPTRESIGPIKSTSDQPLTAKPKPRRHLASATAATINSAASGGHIVAMEAVASGDHRYHEERKRGGEETEDLGGGGRPFPWSKLKALLTEGVNNMVEQLIKQNNLMKKLRDDITERDDKISQLSAKSDKQQAQFEALSDAFSSQKQEISDHFVKLVQESQSKLKTPAVPSLTRQNPQDVLPRTNAVSNRGEATPQGVQSIVEDQGASLHSREVAGAPLNSLIFHEQGAVVGSACKYRGAVAAVAVLAGLYFPLRSRYVQLVEERALLKRLIHSWQFDKCWGRLRGLAATLHSHLAAVGSPESKMFSPRPNCIPDLLKSRQLRGIFRFRVAVIAILATHRLVSKLSSFQPNQSLHLSSSTCHFRPISSVDREGGQIDCRLPISHLITTSLAAHASHDVADSVWQNQTIDWLSSEDLSNAVQSSMHELQTYLSAETGVDHNHHHRHNQHRQLSLLIQRGVSGLLTRLQEDFFPELEPVVAAGGAYCPPTFMWPGCFQQQSSVTLVHRLGTGLSTLLERRESLSPLFRHKDLISTLDQQVLQLCQCLQSAGAAQTLLVRELEAVVGRCQQLEMTADRYRVACGELEAAKRREEQTLLERKQHDEKVAELSSRLDRLTASEVDSADKSRSVACTCSQQVSQCREELRYKEEGMREAERHCEQLDRDITSKDSQIKSLEVSTARMRGEQERCLSYLSQTIDRVTQAGREKLPVDRVLTADKVDTSIEEEEGSRVLLAACRSTVHALLATYGLRLERQCALSHEQVVQYRQQVATLKRQLSLLSNSK